MSEGIADGLSVDEAMRRTEELLLAKYNLKSGPPCPVGGDKAPPVVQRLFGLVPEGVVGRVHRMFKRMRGER